MPQGCRRRLAGDGVLGPNAALTYGSSPGPSKATSGQLLGWAVICTVSSAN